MSEKVARCPGTTGVCGSQGGFCGIPRSTWLLVARSGTGVGILGPQNLGKGRSWDCCPGQEEQPRWGLGSPGSPGRDSFSASLSSQVPPSIREDGRRANVSGMAGQSLTLECDANGFPAPKIVWFKDGQPVGVLWGGRAVGGIWIEYRPSGWVPACARCGKEM